MAPVPHLRALAALAIALAAAPARAQEAAPEPPPGPAIEPPGSPVLPPPPPPFGPYGPPPYGPPPPAYAQPPTYTVYKRADNGLFAGGLLLLAGSGALAVGSLVAIASAPSRVRVFCTHPGSAAYACEERTDAALLGGGVAGLAAGIAGVAVSIYFLAKGGKMVPAPFRAAGPGPSLALDAAGIGLRF